MLFVHLYVNCGGGHGHSLVMPWTRTHHLMQVQITIQVTTTCFFFLIIMEEDAFLINYISIFNMVNKSFFIYF